MQITAATWQKPGGNLALLWPGPDYQAFLESINYPGKGGGQQVLLVMSYYRAQTTTLILPKGL